MASPDSVRAQDETTALEYSLDRIELHIRINTDGTLDVFETQNVGVQRGNLFSGFQNLSLRQLDGIEEMSVEADGRLLNLDDSACAFCYWTVIQPRQSDWVFYDRATFDLVFNPDSMGQVQTFWDFPGITAGEQATFILRYRALGSIQLFEANQRIIWDVTPGFAVPVETAEMFITPPPGLTAEELEIDAGPATLEIDEFGRVALSYDGAVPADAHWFVNITMPAGATEATISNWQRELEAVVEQADAARADVRFDEQEQYLVESRQQFIALGLTILILVLGSIFAYRQRQGPPATALPLSGLPPATLPYMDHGKENPGRSMLAQLITLVDYGLLTINQSEGADGYEFSKLDSRLRERAPWTLTNGSEIRLAPAVVTTFKAIPAGTSSWSQLKTSLSGNLPAIVEDIIADSAEIVARTPARLRERWHKASIGLLIIGMVAFLGAALAGLGRLGWIAFGPGFALLLLGSLIYYQARNDQRTEEIPELNVQLQQYKQRLKTVTRKAKADELAPYLDELAYLVGLNEVETLMGTVEDSTIAQPAWISSRAMMLTELSDLIEVEVGGKSPAQTLKSELNELFAELD